MFRLLFNFWLLPRLLPGCLFFGCSCLDWRFPIAANKKLQSIGQPMLKNQGRFHSREINKRNLNR
jgi:hypothetical protein